MQGNLDPPKSAPVGATLSNPELASALAAYFRMNPSGVAQSPEEVAAATGLPLEGVRRAMRAPERSAAGPTATAPRIANLQKGRPGWWTKAGALWDRTTEQSTLYVVGSSGTAMIIGWLIDKALGSSSAGMASGILILVAILTHLIVYGRSGSFANVLRGSAGLYGVLAAYALLLVANNSGPRVQANGTPMERPDTPIEAWLLIMLGFAFMMILYALIGLLAAAVGGYASIKREDRNLDRMSRQELLDRLFEIQDRLNAYPRSAAEVDRMVHKVPLFAEIARQPIPWAGLLGFGFSVISVFLTASMDMTPGSSSVPSVGQLLILFALTLISLAIQLVLAYIAPTIGKSILTALTYQLAGLPAILIPVGNYGPNRLTENLASMVSGIAFALLLGLIGGLGGLAEKRATYRRRLLENDPETLLSELIEIRRRLTPDMHEITVMVVDAAKSSEMKANADPFVAEWSFRAYQQMLERIAEEHAGQVFSTAGDGATMTFEAPENAIRAARAVQASIDDFNEQINKLESPFRLRIGIHSGKVRGSLEKVQYTEVIDIAAHVEAASEVGGIAVSSAITNQLPDLEGEPFPYPVDGLQVLRLRMDQP